MCRQIFPKKAWDFVRTDNEELLYSEENIFLHSNTNRRLSEEFKLQKLSLPYRSHTKFRSKNERWKNFKFEVRAKKKMKMKNVPSIEILTFLLNMIFVRHFFSYCNWIYSARRLIESLWTNIKVIIMTEWFN